MTIINDKYEDIVSNLYPNQISPKKSYISNWMYSHFFPHNGRISYYAIDQLSYHADHSHVLTINNIISTQAPGFS